MNWGNKILGTILVFVAGMLFMVSIAMRQKNEMIDQNYYQKEMQHQQLIDAEKHLNATGEPLRFSQNAQRDLEIRLPLSAIGHLRSGKVEFIRPNDKRMDFSIPLRPDKEGKQIVEAKYLARGMYQLRISWTNDQVDYYKAENYFVQ